MFISRNKCDILVEEMYIVVSSANKIDFAPFRLYGRSFVCIINSKGLTLTPVGHHIKFGCEDEFLFQVILAPIPITNQLPLIPYNSNLLGTIL